MKCDICTGKETLIHVYIRSLSKFCNHEAGQMDFLRVFDALVSSVKKKKLSGRSPFTGSHNLCFKHCRKLSLYQATHIATQKTAVVCHNDV